MIKNRFIVWKDVKSIRVKRELKELIKYRINGQRIEAWFKMFSLNEDIYLTYEFHPFVENVTDKRMINFNYRGEKQQVSLAEFVIYLGFYTEGQTHSQLFIDSLRSATQDRKHRDIWEDLTGTSFSSNMKASAFLKLEHRLLHKLLAYPVHGKKETNGAVGADDLFLMDAIIKRRNVNVAFLIAELLVYMYTT